VSPLSLAFSLYLSQTVDQTLRGREGKDERRKGIKADQVEKSQNEFPNSNHLMGLINYLLVC